MSVINKMLKELDQRRAAPAPGGTPLRPIRGTNRKAGRGKEAFWRLLAILMLAGVIAIVVIAFELQGQPIVTNIAFKAAEDARGRLFRPPAGPVPQPATAAAPGATPAIPAEAIRSPLVNPEVLKLAPSIQTRIPPERAPVATSPQGPAALLPPGAATKVAGRSAEGALDPAPFTAPSETKAIQGRVEKRDRPRTPQERAEAEFRRGAALLNEGRVNDSKDAFSAALDADRSHEPARQALAALLLDQRQIEPARRLLQDGLAVNPGNIVFASSLARILIESKDYAGALQALQGAIFAGASNAEFQALAGAAHQRLGNHQEAMSAYQASLRNNPGSGTSWIGLGISLDALGHPLEATEAFRRAIDTGSLAADLRTFAEAKLRRVNQPQ